MVFDKAVSKTALTTKGLVKIKTRNKFVKIFFWHQPIFCKVSTISTKDGDMKLSLSSDCVIAGLLDGDPFSRLSLAR